MATMRNDPSIIIDGKVNVITGEPCIFEEDLVIQGIEPIRLFRRYAGGACWYTVESLAQAYEISEEQHYWRISESDGCPLIYKPAEGKRFKVTNLEQGFSNTAQGKISSRTNLKNNYVLFSDDPKIFSLHTAEGVVRDYKKITKRRFKKDHYYHYYQLLSEKLPNGNWVLYEYDDGIKLKCIRTTNPDRTKIYAQADFQGSKVIGSDGQSVEYLPHELYRNGMQTISKVLSSERPDQVLEYVEHKIKKYFPKKKFLDFIAGPLQRQVRFDYYRHETEFVAEQKIILKKESRRMNRVKTLSAPVGADSNLLPTHSFIYHLESNQKLTRDEKLDKHSASIYDQEGNHTDFHWSWDFRLQKIERHSKEGKLQNVEQFVWGKGDDLGNLISKAFFDENRKLLAYRKYRYNKKGDIVEEKYYGNLSGEGIPVVLDGEGMPLNNGAEIFLKNFRYSEGEPSLLEEEEEGTKRTIYKYLPGTDLVSSRSIYDGQELRLTTTFHYNNDHILIRKVDDDGYVRLIKQITPKPSAPYLSMPYIVEEKFEEQGREALLRKEVLTYTTGARIAQKDVYDANGMFRYSLKFTYDSKGRLLTQTNPLGELEKFDYDLCGNLIYLNKGRLATTVNYDFSNRPFVVRKSGDDGIIQESLFLYNTLSQLVSETDSRGAATSHLYDPLGRCITTTLPKIQTERKTLVSPVIQSSYDCSGNETIKIDAEGNRTETCYNAYSKPILVTYPDGRSEKYRYNLNGTLKTHVDPSGVTKSYFYDGLKKLIKQTTSSPNGMLLAEETYAYEGDRLSLKVDAEGNRTTFSYDGAGRKISEKFDGVETTYSYDSLGRVSSIQNDLLATFYEYDLSDRIIEERKQDISTGAVLRLNRTTYDKAGNPKEHIVYVAGNEVREELHYDSFDRLIWKKDFSGAIETISFEDFFVNEQGQKVLRKTHQDPLRLQTIETYDAQNRIAKIEKRKEKTLALEEKIYNRNGFCTLQINTVFNPDQSVRSFPTRWGYDSRNRVVLLTEAEEKTTRYGYTSRGELAYTVKPDGTTLNYAYDDLGNRTNIFSSDGSVRHHRIFNRVGHLTQHDDLKRTVDARGNLRKEIFPQGFAIENSYDSLNRKTRCSISGQGSFDWSYNACDLLRVGRIKEGKRLYEHHYLAYDLLGNLLKEQSILGTLATYSVDASSRKIGIQTPHFSQEVLELDLVGNIRKMLLQGEERAYTYDELYQLTSESGSFVHDYRYDSLYNRLQKDAEEYQINNLQQVVSHFEYDRNGNPIRKGDTRYFYDALDRLIRLEKPDLVQTYTYDAENRCLSKTTHCVGSLNTRYFLYDGQNEIGSFDETLNLQELRLLGGTPHGEICSAIAIELGTETYAPVHDLQGNLAALIGKTPTYYFYSAFGEEKLEGSVKSPWRFSSKRSDKETNLVYFGRRFYLPEFGRWLTPDPAGFTDGTNLYAFVHNDPLTHFDERGLFTIPLVGTPFLQEERNEYVSRFSSKVAHETYNVYAEMGREVDCSMRSFKRFFPEMGGVRQSWDERKNQEDRKKIDALFGTNFTEVELSQKESGIQWTLCEMPAPTMVGCLRRTAQVGRQALSNSSNLGIVKGSGFQVDSKAAQSLPSRNRFAPSPQARGAHTVFRRDPNTQKVTHYETFRPQTNLYDPKPWESIKRYDGSGSDPHYNKFLKQYVRDPHIHDHSPGGIRPALTEEIPK